jgi:hypothetical protein
LTSPTWPLAEITDYLRTIASLEAGSRAFAAFILEHGNEWEPQHFPKMYPAGIPRGCFGNSQDILFSEDGRDGGLIYVEGYACSGSLSFAFPTHHAWLVDVDGKVIDATWEDPETSTYFGVPFSSDYVARTVREAGVPCSMIDNFHDRWELVRTPSLAIEAVHSFERRVSAGISL